jgi:hypothetical protein
MIPPSRHSLIPIIMAKLGLAPDPWQLDVLLGNHKRLLLNCARQAGKSTVVALLSLCEAVSVNGATILLLSRSLRQSQELFRIVRTAFLRLHGRGLKRQTAFELELVNGSRIVSLPCNPDTIRGFSGVWMLVIDEAARVPDELYRTVRPMLAATDGRLICLSTPNGKHGFFYDAWAKGGDDWARIQVPASQCPRIKPEFLAQDRRAYGEAWFRQEFECSFESMQGLVYADFARCIVPPSPLTAEYARFTTQKCPLTSENVRLTKVGGIDFGFRNPFAAVWGVLDRDKVLWLTGEHYGRNQPLSYHAQHLPRKVTWYADPSGAEQIAALCYAGFTVRKGNNAINTGIMAVTRRLNEGTLKVLEGACPNLLHEAGLYRYDDEAGDSETPVDAHNHALAALRYLISRLDGRRLAQIERAAAAGEEQPKEQPQPKKPWLSVWNEELWRRLW